MDVVRTNIQKLNGRIDINSELARHPHQHLAAADAGHSASAGGQVCNQPFAVPLAMVREIIPIQQDSIQEVSGRPTIVVRDEILPVRSLADLLGWQPTQEAQFGVLMQSAERAFILAIDAFVGRDDVVIAAAEISVRVVWRVPRCLVMVRWCWCWIWKTCCLIRRPTSRT